MSRRFRICLQRWMLSVLILRICWPFPVDQADNVSRIVNALEVAWGLDEVRTGTAGKMPIFATGRSHEGTTESFRSEFAEILDKFSGEDGAKKLANAQCLASGMAALWGSSGDAEVAFQRFLKTYVG